MAANFHQAFARRYLLSVLVVSAASEAHAEPKPLTAAQLVARLEAADPRLEALSARLDRAEAEVAEAGRLPNPSLAYDREEVFASGERSADNFVRASISIEISGRRGKRVDAARAGAAATKEEIARAKQLVLLDALDLFHDGAFHQQEVDLLRDAGEDLDRILEIVRARTAAGEASGYDLGRLELEVGAHEDLVEDAARKLAASRRSLGVLMGDHGEYAPIDPLDLGVASTATLSDLRADQRAALLRIQQAEDALSAAGRAWVPELTLSGGLKTSPIGQETGIGYVAGAALTLPFFDHGQAERARALADKRAAEAEAHLLERSVTVDIANARDALARRAAQAERYRDRVVPKLEALLRQAEASYREGERPIFELLDAHRTARDVRLRALELRREAKRSEVDLMRAFGPQGEKK